MKNKSQTVGKTTGVEENTATESLKEVKFSNCNTVGEQINALVKYYAGTQLGAYTLERAAEEAKEMEKKIEAYKDKLLGSYK